jgi:L-aminopeptidase/D-esterase-like protein
LPTLGIIYIYEQFFSLSFCGAQQVTDEWGELNPNWHLEAFGALYTPFWAAYGTIRQK